jgi:hypothetical protein
MPFIILDNFHLEKFSTDWVKLLMIVAEYCFMGPEKHTGNIYVSNTRKRWYWWWHMLSFYMLFTFWGAVTSAYLFQYRISFSVKSKSAGERNVHFRFGMMILLISLIICFEFFRYGVKEIDFKWESGRQCIFKIEKPSLLKLFRTVQNIIDSRI